MAMLSETPPPPMLSGCVIVRSALVVIGLSDIVESVAVTCTTKYGLTENDGKIGNPFSMSAPDALSWKKTASPVKPGVDTLLSVYERLDAEEMGAHHVQDDMSVMRELATSVCGSENEPPFGGERIGATKTMST